MVVVNLALIPNDRKPRYGRTEYKIRIVAEN